MIILGCVVVVCATVLGAVFRITRDVVNAKEVAAALNALDRDVNALRGLFQPSQIARLASPRPGMPEQREDVGI